MITVQPSVDEIYQALHSVSDPEIPTISVVDLGVITNVEIHDDAIAITMTPTFVGCPAIDVMRNGVRDAASVFGLPVDVTVDYSTPWSSNRVTEAGRAALHKHGLALPQKFSGEFEPEILLNAECPHCGSGNTRLTSPFGPTLCRAMYYCNSCLQAFEQFKPV
ncbi:MAG: phenylacetate-CoA oxygenase subunit PaaJ [Candidatus Kapabacteria bacterium]|nr:phenylacetate-CoA oxygenase subunit PaaJ [Candidatus Kapabacteria bacterium]